MNFAAIYYNHKVANDVETFFSFYSAKGYSGYIFSEFERASIVNEGAWAMNDERSRSEFSVEFRRTTSDTYSWIFRVRWHTLAFLYFFIFFVFPHPIYFDGFSLSRTAAVCDNNNASESLRLAWRALSTRVFPLIRVKAKMSTRRFRASKFISSF